MTSAVSQILELKRGQDPSNPAQRSHQHGIRVWPAGECSTDRASRRNDRDLSPELRAARRKLALLGGLCFRLLSIALLIALTLRVSIPQSETIWSAYQLPDDLIRIALGTAACVWMLIQLFKAPKDDEEYRIWLYAGPPIALFVAICVMALR